jgi:hypothetical protein
MGMARAFSMIRMWMLKRPQELVDLHFQEAPEVVDLPGEGFVPLGAAEYPALYLGDLGMFPERFRSHHGPFFIPVALPGEKETFETHPLQDVDPLFRFEADSVGTLETGGQKTDVLHFSG